jgi:Galactose-3-O-sulfotransferase
VSSGPSGGSRELAAETEGRCLVFVHVPRTGGTTIERVLDRKYRSRVLHVETLWDPLAFVGQLPLEQRATADAIAGHVHYGVHDHVPRQCVYVTMLRDPVARVASMYHFIRGNPKHWLHPELIRTGIDLEEFARTAADPGVDNQQTRLIAGIGSGELGQPPSKLGPEALEAAKTNLRTFVVVGLTERFDESFILLRRALGWRLPMYMSVNAAKDADQPPTAAAVAAIRERNRLDLDLYRFARGLLEAAVAEQGSSFRREVAAFQALNRIPDALGPRTPPRLRRLVRRLPR